MNLNEIKSITISLLKRETDVKDNTAAYSKKITAKFTPPLDFPQTEEMYKSLLESMYNDLIKNAPGNPEDIDSIGMWVEMDSITLDNALSLQTLDDIKMYSKEDINPVYEFFKMTIMNG